MGAYLSTPRTEKDSSDEKSEEMVCGASSMQGWRINQEDAHNCELNFDKDASFFAVYDGHGGPEIALYCSKYLPAFLKSTEAYARGDFEQALKDAFLGFDAKLLHADVIEELKVLAGEKMEGSDEDEEDSDEDLSELKNEGRMPIEEVLTKYNNVLARLKSEEAGGPASSRKPASPCLRGKKQAVTAGGSAENGNDKPSGSTSAGDEAVSSSSAEGASSSGTAADNSSDKAATTSKPMESPDSSSAEANKVGNSEATAVGSSEKGAGESSSSTTTNNKANDVSSSSSSSSAAAAAEAGGSSSSTSNGESSSSSGISSGTDRAAKRVAMQISGAVPDSGDSDEEDGVDVTYDGNNSTDDDAEEEGDDDSEEDSEDCEEEEDTDEDDDDGEEVDEEADGFINNMVEEPGKDSGCTAVVALRQGRTLYVANAGDSRCVLSRSGEVIEMSFDHKPEDTEEHQRITKAGGRVTMDGRVNGGLNLSRAIGDHAYKMNVDLPPAEQMISAMPDIKKIELTDADDFMVLACDGIWNFMSSEAVVKFVQARLDKYQGKLSKICEELFDHCLAKDTSGDGTGCDNMTAIIVRFKWSQKDTKNSEAAPVLEVGLKRAASSSPLPVPEISEAEADGGIKAKRAKTDVEEAPTTTSA